MGKAAYKGKAYKWWSGPRLREQRKAAQARGVPQAQTPTRLAAEVGVSQGTYYRWENDNVVACPDADQFAELVSILGIKPCYLISLADRVEPADTDASTNDAADTSAS